MFDFCLTLLCLVSHKYDVSKQCRPRPLADPEGGGGGAEPPENHKNIGFLAILVLISCKTKRAFNVGPSSARF